MIVPLVGLAELAAHASQVSSVVSDADWLAARAAVKSEVKADDLVAFAPAWVDPIGRHFFGDEIATLGREARPDESRFARALEVSIRGKHLPALSGWKSVSVEHFGAVTVTTFANPSYTPIKDDLVDHLRPETARVARFEGEREAPCEWREGATQAGNLGGGPAVPGNKFVCPGNSFVGVSVLPDLDYDARRCIYAPPPGGRGGTRIEFDNVLFGKTIRGHHGLYAEAERDKSGAPVTLRFKAGDRTLPELTHNDGDGWSSFELDTSALEGQRQTLTVEVSASNGQRRQYCFEAETR